MTNSIEKIRARHKACGHIIEWPDFDSFEAYNDRATLLRALDAMAEENAKLREALQTIHDRYIPSQPAAYDVSEADYTRKHYMELRMIARAALSQEAGS